jgi:hypothetical protein
MAVLCRESRLRQAATVLGAFGDGMRPAAPCTGSSTEKIAGRRHVSVVPHSPSVPSGRFLPASSSAGYFSAAVGADFSVHCGRLIVMRGDLSNRKENTFPS